MEREVGGGIGMGNTCKPMAVSFQCMTKFTAKKKKKTEQQAVKNTIVYKKLTVFAKLLGIIYKSLKISSIQRVKITTSDIKFKISI